MAADLEAVGIVAQMVGVVDGPARQPEHLALERGQSLQRGLGDWLGHRQPACIRRFYPLIMGIRPRRCLPNHTIIIVLVGVFYQL